jgi:hypothetical protein
MEAVNDAAFSDVVNNFCGCIAGCHDALRRRRLLQRIRRLDLNEDLSRQVEAIERVIRRYPERVAANRERWLS